ncbi:ATP-binding protein [Paucibacter soli]|uniref:ATP-binding protein n=1 Tax=Paucibacter soli TaxID=3133433 RepID=UPI0030A34FDA
MPASWPHRLERKRDALLVALTLAVGGIASLLGYAAVGDAERLRFKELRSAAARQVVDSFTQDLARTVEAVRGAGLMLESQQPTLQRETFNRYAAKLAEGLPGLMLLEWQPIVPHARLAQFEAQARALGLADYRVIEPGPTPDSWVPVRARPEHVPVLFGWPENASPIGLDLAFDALRMASKLEARASGRPVASLTFTVIHRRPDARPVTGFAITAPVYARGAPGEHPSAIGYLAGVIELPSLFRRAAQLAERLQLDLLVHAADQPDKPPIYVHGNADIGPLAEAHAVEVAGRTWNVRLQPRPGFIAGAPPQVASLVLAAGLAATLLLSASLWWAQRRSRAAAQAQSRLLSESERLQNIIAATGVGTWDYSFETRKAAVSERWREIAGHGPSDWQPGPDYHWKQDCHPDDIAAVDAVLRAHLRGETDHYEVEYRHRHGTEGWTWVATRGKVIRRDRAGKPLQIVGMMMEVNTRKQAEARILELNNTLEQRVRERSAQLEATMEKLCEVQEALSRTEARATLSTMVAGVSHELSTPMSNGLIASSTLSAQAVEFERRIAAGGLRRSELQHFVEQVRSGSQLVLRNLQRAVELLSGFRQVTADQASEQRRHFDLHELIQEIVGTLTPTLKRRPQRLLLDIPAGIAMDSYPGPLGQVAINLINNAYLHAFEEGQAGELRIQARQEGDKVRIEFRDNGRGMSQEALDKIFLPFFSTKIGKGGTGLGMAIVQTLSSKTLGGSVSVSSQPGQGTCVTVLLPLRAPELAE